MEAAISADIVSSTSMSSEDLSNLRDKLKDTIDHFENSIDPTGKSFWGRIIKGDSIECYLHKVEWSLRVALALKLRTKAYVASLDCSKETKKYGIRFAIGAGSFKMVDRKRDIIDGFPIYFSGRKMQEQKKFGHRLVFQAEADPYEISMIINNNIIWLDDKVNNLSAKQCEAVYYMLLDYTRNDILKLLKIKQNTLSQRLTSADWNNIKMNVIDFEHLYFNFFNS